MRHEPIEFGAVTDFRHRARRRRAHAGRTSTRPTTEAASMPTVEVVDEAFAGFQLPAQRPLEHSLVVNLSAQLKALDRQREQLSQLLRSIDAASISR